MTSLHLHVIALACYCTCMSKRKVATAVGEVVDQAAVCSYVCESEIRLYRSSNRSLHGAETRERNLPVILLLLLTIEYGEYTCDYA